jgi:hypothetical protein
MTYRCPKSLATLALTASVAILSACNSVPKPHGPVLIQTARGEEQGVNTPYGVVFLGRTANEGRCDVVVFYGDGPSVEPGEIRAAGADLYRVDLAVRAPASEISFTYPAPDDDLILSVVQDDSVDFYHTQVATAPGAGGTVVDLPGGFPATAAATGAGLYRKEDGRYRLVGLVNGMARYEDASGRARSVLTYVGPRDLVPFVLQNKDQGRAVDAPRREDVIR